MLGMTCTPPYDTRTAIRTVKRNLVSATPNVVVVVCVCAPTRAPQFNATLPQHMCTRVTERAGG
eukprot:1868362-Prymnesium_polylepis.1